MFLLMQLLIEEAKGEPDSVPSYSTSSPLNYESALARQKLQDGMAKKSNSLFWLGSFVVVLIFILSVVIYFFLLKFA